MRRRGDRRLRGGIGHRAGHAPRAGGDAGLAGVRAG